MKTDGHTTFSTTPDALKMLQETSMCRALEEIRVNQYNCSVCYKAIQSEEKCIYVEKGTIEKYDSHLSYHIQCYENMAGAVNMPKRDKDDHAITLQSNGHTWTQVSNRLGDPVPRRARRRLE